MSKSLVIVESPTKANTIKKYLGRGYVVKASVGHIRDLPTKNLGVDLENNFAPTYEIIKGKKKGMDEIIEAARDADAIYLAPDPDREGEAIAWHVAEAIREGLGGKKPRAAKKATKTAKTAKPAAKKTTKKSSAAATEEVSVSTSVPGVVPIMHRVLFHEITAPAVKAAIAAPTTLNPNLFEAQQARRILDRLVGYQVSPILWEKVRRGLSAGRVQSVALRIICEREAGIKAFVPVEYWSLVANFEGKSPPPFEAKLVLWDGKKPELTDNITTDAVVAALANQPFTLTHIKRQERKRNPQPPFITSKLQQEAARKLGFTAKKTMMLAQRLYEGIELGEGPVGLITYMRTDSVRVSDTALAQVRETIAQRFGAHYVPSEPVQYRNKRQGVQDAHEAIRPSMLEISPEQLEGVVERDLFRLYDLIWKRFVASQMMPAKFDQTTFEIEAARAQFRATGSIMTFDGFIAVYLEGIDDAAETDEEDNAKLPQLTEGEVLTCHLLQPHQHFTQPPPRFTEASLVKELEERGIGRPSTYAAIMSNIQDKEYVSKEQGRFFATELGSLVNNLLVENFPKIFDVGFTAAMETELDDVEEGRLPWVKALRDFYTPFAETLALAKAHMRDVKRQEIPTEFACEKCGKTMLIKWGRNGEFLACSGYPECKSTADFRRVDGKLVLAPPEEATDAVCPKCGAPMIIKRGRFGRFMACSKYPECKTAKGIPVGVKCPQDGGDLVEKRSRKGRNFYSCENYPNCKFAVWDRPVKEPCPQCQHPFLVESYSKKSGRTIKCPQKECGYARSGEPDAAVENAGQ